MDTNIRQLQVLDGNAGLLKEVVRVVVVNRVVASLIGFQKHRDVLEAC